MLWGKKNRFFCTALFFHVCEFFSQLKCLDYSRTYICLFAEATVLDTYWGCQKAAGVSPDQSKPKCWGWFNLVMTFNTNVQFSLKIKLFVSVKNIAGFFCSGQFNLWRLELTLYIQWSVLYKKAKLFSQACSRLSPAISCKTKCSYNLGIFQTGSDPPFLPGFLELLGHFSIVFFKALFLS